MSYSLFFADNCKKLGLVFDDVVGIVEIINSRDVKVQVSVCDLFSAWSVTDARYNRASVASASLSSFISRTGMCICGEHSRNTICPTAVQLTLPSP